eukprot:TRINITY_DN372_c0_g2_i1.p1 TRINITY_DN372_c0_g2~~TRINITY_DN372_c0_g2_i1.p1  ORF type:complete len:365 (+),score=26.19 TRINITY_DN372_c0_g2_i1:498-1592(+)
MKFSTLYNEYHRQRNRGVVCSSLFHFGEQLSISVGSVVEILSVSEYPTNWLLHVTELHNTGFVDAGGSGYFLYREEDIRRLPLCSGFKSSSPFEVFPSYHRFHLSITNVVAIHHVVPGCLLHKQTGLFFYKTFIDLRKLSFRPLVFEIGTPAVLLGFLQAGMMCANSAWFLEQSAFVSGFIRRMIVYCDRKQIPHSKRGPRWSLDLPPLNSLLTLPTDLFELVTFNRSSHSFTLTASKFRQLDLLFREDGRKNQKWEVVYLAAKKHPGAEQLQFTFIGPMSINFPVHGTQIHVSFAGLRKLNGSRTLQWDTTHVPPRRWSGKRVLEGVTAPRATAQMATSSSVAPPVLPPVSQPKDEEWIEMSE